ncbi:aldolase/citrate lyase family protein [Neobacillus citreus]|uniref:HpcH/HpaI aldolase/citrate lyase family protein n=1 Tax=Neobacillus citreus TaxID=2833578 RepID=A0A942T1X9_9BACI|nr:aldolase/citrate lyase family protein [Neobacillus citreus]MCH6265999.1 HpcH/HpaI aldolase/citrate lyase family protein [Neobacillus citreus]
MSLKLMYITNNEKIAKIAECHGVDWIFIDLEINGKTERQGHLNTVISRHSVDDVVRIKKVLSKSQLLVRVNPIFNGSKDEIDRVIEGGADIVMLPFFKSKEEVKIFIDYVRGRAQVCLLCETPEAVVHIDSILEAGAIDYIHIGLNDLYLGYKMKFMFEPLANGTVEMLCNKFKTKGIKFGFGGIAQLGRGTLPAENIIAEHYRLGSTMTILSRSFCDSKLILDIDKINETMKNGIKNIRDYEDYLSKKEDHFFNENREIVVNKVLSLYARN